MTAILSALGAVGDFIKLLGALFGWFHDESEKQTGVKLQQGADAEASLARQKAVDAVANKPVSDDDVERALKGGTF